MFKDGVSVTQQEYRIAAGLAQADERLQQVYSSTMLENATVRDIHTKTFVTITEAHKQRRSGVTVPVEYVAFLFSQSSLIEDITNLSVALLRYIYEPNASIQYPQLNEVSLIIGESERIERETPTEEDIRKWVISQDWLLSRA